MTSEKSGKRREKPNLSSAAFPWRPHLHQTLVVLDGIFWDLSKIFGSSGLQNLFPPAAAWLYFAEATNSPSLSVLVQELSHHGEQGSAHACMWVCMCICVCTQIAIQFSKFELYFVPKQLEIFYQSADNQKLLLKPLANYHIYWKHDCPQEDYLNLPVSKKRRTQQLKWLHPGVGGASELKLLFGRAGFVGQIFHTACI